MIASVTILVALAVCSLAAFAVVKRHSYYKDIGQVKEVCMFQTIPSCEMLVSVYEALGDEGFFWDGRLHTKMRPGYAMITGFCDFNLLWYQFDYSGRCYLIDMPWLEFLKFRVWHKLYEKRRNKGIRLKKQRENGSNDVLDNIKKRLNNQIEKSELQVRSAIAEQEEILERLAIDKTGGR